MSKEVGGARVLLFCLYPSLEPALPTHLMGRRLHLLFGDLYLYCIYENPEVHVHCSCAETPS